MRAIFKKERVRAIFWASIFGYLNISLLSVLLAEYFSIPYIWWLHWIWKKVFSFLDVWPPG